MSSKHLLALGLIEEVAGENGPAYRITDLGLSQLARDDGRLS
jgi:hypothetical protein